jgi:hypothetical protein
MKSIILCTILLLSITCVSAQQVTLDDLMKPTVNEKSSSKQWVKELNDAKEISVAKSILSNELIKMTKSKHWISLSLDGEMTKELSFQTSKKMHLDRMIENLIGAGFQLENTKTDIDSKTFVYSKNSLKIEVLALATENTATTVYLVTLL